MKILELFGGIGACSKAFKRLGIPVEIADYVEIDKYAVKSYNAINGTNFEPQDITKWNKDIDVDFIMHGSPCQDFSVAGLNKGGDEGSGTRSSLMYETIRIVNKLKPKYVLWENVKNLLSKKHIHNFKNYISTMNELGYNSYYQVLNSKNYGIPQNRERVFTLSIRQDIDNGTFIFPKPFELKLKLKDMLEQDVDEKYYLSNKMMTYISANNDKWTGNNNESIINKDIASTINTGEGQRRCDASNYISDMLPENYNIKQQDGYIEKKYENFIKKNGYIPEMFNPYNESEIKEIAPTQSTCCGSTTSSATILIKNNTKLGYQVAVGGDRIDLENINSKTRRGRVQKGMAQTLNTQDNKGVVVETLKKQLCNKLVESHAVVGGGIVNHSHTNSNSRDTLEKYIESKDGIFPTMTTRPDVLGVAEKKDDLRIRKLTPKECWRLMGFDDSDFEKAEKTNSNAQLYKQAGNSIVVNVLEKILENLFLTYQNDFEGQMSFDMLGEKI